MLPLRAKYCNAFYPCGFLHRKGRFFCLPEAFVRTGVPFFVLMLNVFCSVMCNLLVNYAAGKMPVVKLSSLGSLTTLCSMFTVALFLNEPMTHGLLFGAVLILVGIRQVTKQ